MDSWKFMGNGLNKKKRNSYQFNYSHSAGSVKIKWKSILSEINFIHTKKTQMEYWIWKKVVSIIYLFRWSNSDTQETEENIPAYKVSGLLAKKLRLLHRKHPNWTCILIAQHKNEPKKVDWYLILWNLTVLETRCRNRFMKN